MKKAGSSSSRSKTPRTSKSSAATTTNKKANQTHPLSGEVRLPSEVRPESLSGIDGIGAGLVEAIGHRPPHALKPQDEALFRAFQSNLLSLISHELRTPLMGILNALGLLEDGVETPEFSHAEMVKIARQNAQRLQRALSALLDLASLDSGTFHARLREVDLRRLVAGRVDAAHALIRDRGLTVEQQADDGAGAPVLADPQKLGRAVDLCLQALIPRSEQGTRLQLRATSSSVEISLRLSVESEPLWDAAWTQAAAGFQGGVASPSSAFAGVLQSEQAFLTRMEEGLGSEFMLIHEILKLHRGRFDATRQGRGVTLVLEVPELADEEGLRSVLASRAYEVSTELGSVALVMLKIPRGARSAGDGGDLADFNAEFVAEVRRNLFRASDAVYELRARGELALVLDDCKREDAPKLMDRVLAKVQAKLGLASVPRYGVAQCPADGLDPALLLGIARERV